ncbi:MAG: hypothetical protein [brine shrimp artovirus 1]|nr:MAG: hypothetical protein [brine shrimp artovirus 1]
MKLSYWSKIIKNFKNTSIFLELTRVSKMSESQESALPTEDLQGLKDAISEVDEKSGLQEVSAEEQEAINDIITKATEPVMVPEPSLRFSEDYNSDAELPGSAPPAQIIMINDDKGIYPGVDEDMEARYAAALCPYGKVDNLGRPWLFTPGPHNRWLKHRYALPEQEGLPLLNPLPEPPIQEIVPQLPLLQDTQPQQLTGPAPRQRGRQPRFPQFQTGTPPCFVETPFPQHPWPENQRFTSPGSFGVHMITPALVERFPVPKQQSHWKANRSRSNSRSRSSRREPSNQPAQTLPGQGVKQNKKPTKTQNTLNQVYGLGVDKDGTYEIPSDLVITAEEIPYIEVGRMEQLSKVWLRDNWAGLRGVYDERNIIWFARAIPPEVSVQERAQRLTLARSHLLHQRTSEADLSARERMQRINDFINSSAGMSSVVESIDNFSKQLGAIVIELHETRNSLVKDLQARAAENKEFSKMFKANTQSLCQSMQHTGQLVQAASARIDSSVSYNPGPPIMTPHYGQIPSGSSRTTNTQENTRPSTGLSSLNSRFRTVF